MTTIDELVRMGFRRIATDIDDIFCQEVELLDLKYALDYLQDCYHASMEEGDMNRRKYCRASKNITRLSGMVRAQGITHLYLGIAK